MQVLIAETKEVKKLPKLTCPISGYDYDIIADYLAYGSSIEDIDNNFVRMEYLQDDDKTNEYNQYDEDIYLTNQKCFDWWLNTINLTEEGNNLIYDNDDILTDEIEAKLEDAFNYSDLSLIAKHRLGIIKKALANIEVKGVLTHDYWAGFVNGKCIEITHKDWSDDETIVTYTASGTFIMVGEDAEKYDEFDASIAGSYAVKNGDNNEVVLDDTLDCQENLTENQTNKVREFLLEVIKKQLTEDGYQVD